MALDNVSLATAPSLRDAPPAQRFAFAAAALIFLVLAAVSLPALHQHVGLAGWFIPTYGSAMAIVSLLTAYLILGHAEASGSAAQGALVGGYVWIGLLILAQTMTFQGVFIQGGLFGAGPDTASWLYFFWHIGFPLWVALYVLLGWNKTSAHGAMRTLAASAIALALGAIWLSLHPGLLFPSLRTDSDYFNAVRVTLLGISTAVTLIVLASVAIRGAGGAKLDLWLSVALLGWFFDEAFSFSGAARFSVGWYEGRVDSGIAALAVFLGLSYDYARSFFQMRDVVERLRVATEFRTMAEAIPHVIFTMKANGTLEFVTNKWFELTGQEPEEIFEPRGWMPVVHPSDGDQVLAAMLHGFRTGEPFDVNARLRLLDGSFRWFRAQGLPERGQAGRIVKWYGTLTDIDSQKRAEERLQELYGREHRVAETLQRAFLPRFLPEVPGLRFGSVYRPNTAEANVGGDWYDAFELPGGAIAISLGDVAGHGLEAAVTMGRVRETFRAAATVDVGRPDLVLQRANRALMLSEPGVLVTALFGVIDPATLRFTYATAGHPAPMFARVGEPVRSLAGGGLPLGYDGDMLSPVHDLLLEPGDFLAVYTDGLVEATHDYDEGERRLAEAVRIEASSGGRDTAESIVSAVLGDEPLDDVALLTIAVEKRPRDFISVRLPAQPKSAPLVRSHLHDFLELVALDSDMVFNMTLAVGEAVNNAIEHAYEEDHGDVELRCQRFESDLVIEVRDQGSWTRDGGNGRLPEDSSERGRGLYLIQTLFPSAVIERTPRGTTVRIPLPLAGTPHARREAV